MTIKLSLIGSGAVRANPSRRGTCQLLEIDGRRWLIDCGRSAVHGLSQMGVPAESIDQVMISHLHFDHLCDLPHLVLLAWNNGRDQPLPFIGPEGLENFLDHGIRKAYVKDIDSRLHHGKDPSGLNWNVREVIGSGMVQAEDECHVTGMFTEHGTLANINYRFDIGSRRIVVLSDTVPDPRLVDFCQGADLIVCECSGTRQFLDDRPWGHWHMAPEDVAQLGRKSGAQHLILKHLVIEDWIDDPRISEKMAQQVRAEFDGQVAVGTDGMTVDLSTSQKSDPVMAEGASTPA